MKMLCRFFAFAVGFACWAGQAALGGSFTSYYSGGWDAWGALPETDPVVYGYPVWYGSSYPGAGDTVDIRNNVSSTNSRTVQYWTMTAGDLDFAGNTFTPTSGATWISGSFLGYLHNNALVTLTGDGMKRIRHYGIVHNHGTFRQDGGVLDINGNPNTAHFNNYEGALYDIRTDGTNVVTADYGYFNNWGTLRKSTGSGTAVIWAPVQGGAGVVEVQSGKLVFSGNNTYVTNGGTFNVSAGCELDLAGSNYTSYVGTFSGTSEGRVGWRAGSMGYLGGTIDMTVRFTNGFFWSGGKFFGPLRNDALMVLDGEDTKENYISALNNYGTIRQTNGGALYLNKFNNTCYLNNQTGAVYEIQTDGTNVTASSLEDVTDAFYNYGTLAKTGGDGTSTVKAAFCNVGGTVNVQRGTLVFGAGGMSTGGTFNVASGAALDLVGNGNTCYRGTYSGDSAGRVGWSAGTLGHLGGTIDMTVRFTNGFFWGGGKFFGPLRNDGLMVLDGSAAKENYISALDNYGTIRQTNDGPLYLNKFNNTCYLNNRTGAVYEIQSDGTNVTASSLDDATDAFYNYGLLAKTGGSGTSTVKAAFCNVGGTVSVQRGTLVLGGGGVSSGGTYNVESGAALDVVGGGNPEFYGTYGGSGGGWVGWGSGNVEPNSAFTLAFTNGFHWAGGRYWGSGLRNEGVLVLEGEATKENFISTIDNYGTVRQTNGGAFYLNKFNNTVFFQNRTGATYEIESDGTNLTCSAQDDANAAFYNYGTLAKTGGEGTSTVKVALYNLGGTASVHRGTMVLGGGGLYSNGTFHAAAGAVLDLAGTGNPQWFGELRGEGEGVVQWSGGWLGDGTSATLNFTNGLHWLGGTLRGYLANRGLLLLDGPEQKNPEYYSTIDNFGTIRQQGEGPLRMNGNPNTCTVNNQAGATFELAVDGTNVVGDATYGKLNNYGTLAKTAGDGVSFLQCDVRNYGGTVDVRRGTVRLSGFTQTAGVFRLSGGNAAISSSTISGGRLEGTGTVAVAGTLTSAGEVSPGFSIGTLTITGNYSQSASGVLRMEIGGAEAGESDLLQVGGTATLGGTVAVSFANGFVPSFGQSFTLLTRGAAAGSFGAISSPALPGGLSWRPVYSNAFFRLDAVGSVQFGAATIEVAENAGTATLAVTRTGMLAGELTVPYWTSNGTARAGFDYVGSTGTVTFADGQSATSIVVALLDNAWVDDNETFTVRLGTPAGHWQLGAASNATVRAIDDEIGGTAAFPVFEAFTSAVPATAWRFYSTGAGRIQVSASNSPFSPVRHLTMDSTGGVASLNEAVLSANLAGRSNVWLRFRHKEFNDTDNAMPTTFSGHTNADGVAVSVDGTNWYRAQGLVGADGIRTNYRHFTVRIDSIPGAAPLATNTRIKFQQYGAAAIPSGGFAFDDVELFELAGTVQFATNAATVAENGGSVTVRVQRTSGAGACAVGYETVDGTARGGMEYVSATGMVSFAAGATSAPVVVAILDNAMANDARTFSVALGDVTGSFVVGSASNATATITDNEAATAGTLPFFDGFEAAPSNGWWTYSSGKGRIQISTNHGPLGGAWHLLLDATSTVASLNEAVLVLNGAGSSNVWLSFYQREFSEADHAMASSFAGHANADGVALSVNGTNWYRAVSLTGANSTSFYRQTFVSLSEVAATNGLALTNRFWVKFQQYGTGTITNGGMAFDNVRVFTPLGYVGFATNAQGIPENSTATCRVFRTSAGETVQVRCATVDGSARDGFEYRGTNLTLTMSGSTTSATATASAIDNGYANENSAFTMAIAGVDGRYLLSGAYPFATVSITNNDAGAAATLPFSDGFESGTFSNCWSIYGAGAGLPAIATSPAPHAGSRHLVMASAVSNVGSLNEATLTVNLAGRSNVWLTFIQRELPDVDHVMATAFSGHANVDGVAVSTNGTNWYRVLSLTGTQSSTNNQARAYSLDAVAATNGLAFGDRFQIKFQQYGAVPSPSGGFAFDSVAVYESAGSIQFATNRYEASETSGVATLSVTRTTSAGAMSVDYVALDGTARAPGDFEAATGTVVFAAGTTQQTFTVGIHADRFAEGPEWFSVALGNYVGGSPGSSTSALVQVEDREATMLLSADFSGGLPAGWSVTTNAHTNGYWRFDDPKPRGNLTGGSGPMAIADSDQAGPIDFDSELRTPAMTCTGMATARLKFSSDFYRYSTEYADVDVSLDGANGPWTNVWRKTGTSQRGPTVESILLPSLLGQTNAMVRFRYHNANYEMWWQVDDMAVLGESDLDGDGLPDWWEGIYGSETGMVAGADADGDDMSNYAEFVAGTDPTNEFSYLAVVSPLQGPEGAGAVVRWTSASNWYYRIDRSTNLVDGFVQGVLTSLPATPPMNVCTDAAPAGAGPMYYRIGVEAR